MSPDDWVDDDERTVVLDVPFQADAAPIAGPEIQVAGVSFRPRNVELLMTDGLEIWLAREPDNPHDSNAIAVYASWRWKNGRIGEGRVGFLPAPVAAQYVALADVGRLAVRPLRYVLPVPDRASGLIFVELAETSGPQRRTELSTGRAVRHAPITRTSKPATTRRRARSSRASRRTGTGCVLALLLVAPALGAAAVVAAARAFLGRPTRAPSHVLR